MVCGFVFNANCYSNAKIMAIYSWLVWYVWSVRNQTVATEEVFVSQSVLKVCSSCFLPTSGLTSPLLVHGGSYGRHLRMREALILQLEILKSASLYLLPKSKNYSARAIVLGCLIISLQCPLLSAQHLVQW